MPAGRLILKGIHLLVIGELLLSTALCAETVNIGGATTLFIDDHIVETLGGASRSFHQGQKTGPFLEADSAWQRPRSLAYPTVRRESPTSWKMWYRAATTAGDRVICYATSTDGVNWNTPSLGIHSYNGGNNNAVLHGPDTPSVFREHDGNYYMYCMEDDSRYLSFTSPDGINNWTRCNNGLHADDARVRASGTIVGGPHYDITLGAYDEYRDDYIFNFKISRSEPLFGPNDWQRIFHQHRYSGSLRDLKDTPFPYCAPRFELADTVDDTLIAGTLRSENYGTGMYPQEDGSVIGFSWLFNITSHDASGFSHYGHIVPQLIYTRNIDSAWQRVTRTPIIPRGSSSDAWDWGMIITANQPVEVPQAETFGASTDQVWMYFLACNHLHNQNPPGGNGNDRNHRVGVAKWRVDGFVSLQSDSNEDTITTKALTFTGNQLTLNADIPGQIQVEIIDENNNVLQPKSDILTGDNQAHVVRWNGNDDIAVHSGATVKLRFYCTDCDLYALRFTDIDTDTCQSAVTQPGL